MLFESGFLRLLGLAMLAGYVALSKLYFFRIPYRGVLVATALYAGALLAALLV